MTTIVRTTLELPGASLGPENPLPFFRDVPDNKEVLFLDSVPEALRSRAGDDCAFRALPYRMQDAYSRDYKPMRFDAIVMENEHLRARFVPELGGRLWSLFDKDENRELLASNDAFRPANLAIRNAWFSGGIEWNIGHFGHACHSCAPVHAAIIQRQDANPSLRLYDFERMTGLFWQIDFSLPDVSRALFASVRILNPSDDEAPLYWWTNIAAPESIGTRVLAPARSALYLDPSSKQAHRFGLAELPRLPSLPSGDASGSCADGTFSLNARFANEFFFLCNVPPSGMPRGESGEGFSLPWEAVVEKTGRGFFECSTEQLRYRKLFAWGNHPGGRRWQEFLGGPGAAYLEIQAGLAPTQLHGARIGPRASLAWTQAFGALNVDPGISHGDDWSAACAECARALGRGLSPEDLRREAVMAARYADAAPDTTLCVGTGFLALEALRKDLRGRLPPAFNAPRSDIGPEERTWFKLLDTGIVPPDTPLSGTAFMTSPGWRALIERSLSVLGGRNAASLYHAGVAAMEAGDAKAARDYWLESTRLSPRPEPLRNLARIALREKNDQQALSLYEKAWASAKALGARCDTVLLRALVEEYMQLLISMGNSSQAAALYDALPSHVASADRPALLRAQAALIQGDEALASRLIEKEFAVIREGETTLTDIWFGLAARRIARERGEEVFVDDSGKIDPGLLDEAARRFPPPSRIDFRTLGA